MHKSPPPTPSQNSDDLHYINWKNWGKTFGVLSKPDQWQFDREIARTKHQFQPNTQVLEIGFGNGTFLAYAKNRGWQISGTELNQALVSIATENGFHAVHTADLTPFTDNSFDLIVAFDVLEHIPQDKIPQFLMHVNRVLKPGGYFIARFPNGDGPGGMMFQNGDVTHVTILGRHKIDYFAKITEMTVIFCGPCTMRIFGSGWIQSGVRALLFIIRYLMNLWMNLVVFGGENNHYYSVNLVAIFQVDKAAN